MPTLPSVPALLAFAACLGVGGCNAIFGLDGVPSSGDGVLDGSTDGTRADGLVGDGEPLDAREIVCDPTLDEDGDAENDCVDNCPHLSNAGQANADSDGVGDLCEPHAEAAEVSDHIVAFHGGQAGHGAFVTMGNWSSDGDVLQLAGVGAGSVESIALAGGDYVEVRASVRIPTRPAVGRVEVRHGMVSCVLAYDLSGDTLLLTRGATTLMQMAVTSPETQLTLVLTRGTGDAVRCTMALPQGSPTVLAGAAGDENAPAAFSSSTAGAGFAYLLAIADGTPR